MAKNYYVSGSHNCICDVCGQKIKFEKAKLRWDGLLVCPEDFETRQPQDFVRAKTDKITVPITRPRPPDVFKYPIGLSDSILFTDSVVLSKAVTKTFSDIIAFTDSFTTSKTVSISDTLNFSETFVKNAQKVFSESLTLSESFATQRTQNITDTLTLSDSFQKQKTVTLTDIITFTETGTTTLPLYASEYYFASDYTLTSQTII